ncbi:MAG: PEGA domain-containing protein [Kofleriaceae bacterium]
MKAFLIVCLLAATAFAQKTIAVAPLSTFGAEDKSAATKKLVGQIEQAVGQHGDKVIPASQVSAAIDKAKKPLLRQCEGDSKCFTEVGKLVSAQIVISGEIGGLGDAKVVYLLATDVATGNPLRSTTLAVGSDDGGAAGAVLRLLDPDKYRGTLHFTIDAQNASVFINGAKTTLGPKGDIALPVGTQAVRVTHPEYHDFIKFIDVTYGKTIEVPVNLQQYPIVEHDVKAKPTSRDTIVYVDPPWYRRWYIYPIMAAVAVGVGIGVAAASHDFPSVGECRTPEGNKC